MSLGAQVYWGLAGLLACGALVAHLALSSRIVQTGYAIEAARAEQEQLRDELALRQVELQRNRDPRRIRRFAEDELKMGYPSQHYDLEQAARARRCNADPRHE